ncbi:MAG: Holliday junction branch migration protein RuvA [Bdellovibrionales bacterium]|nr:Holliday junction branch migration protein RuvA [Bdellovibrionales bacterium]
MISSLRGRLLEINKSTVTLDVQGVGYEICCSRNCIESLEVGAQAAIVIYTVVREDSITLYGFADRLEKQVFLLLLQVKGVGARSASEILSCADKRDLLRIIAAGDVNGLQSIRGVGKKTAERIVVELRDKVGNFIVGGQADRLGVERIGNAALQDAVAAMEALGFSSREANAAVQALHDHGDVAKMDAGQIVKEALRFV